MLQEARSKAQKTTPLRSHPAKHMQAGESIPQVTFLVHHSLGVNSKIDKKIQKGDEAQWQGDGHRRGEFRQQRVALLYLQTRHRGILCNESADPTLVPDGVNINIICLVIKSITE